MIHPTAICYKPHPDPETDAESIFMNWSLNRDWLEHEIAPRITGARQMGDYVTADYLKAFVVKELGLTVQCYPNQTLIVPCCR